MEQKMKNNLKIGFLLSRYGIDAFYSALLFTILWVALIIIKPSNNSDILGILMIIFIVVGFILFFVGRIFVGLQSRKLNLYMDRPRTVEEEWFLNEMINVEKNAARENLANQFAKLTPNKADNIIFASASVGTIKHYFAVGKVYLDKNVFVNRIIIIASLIVALAMFMINFI